ncbi:UNVERIFIED_CONTAM: hypothetical protein PYX00_004932 [Menopon gallinae]|uniref:Transporter n=1 Tax=Menopon gallinae TaxID=328185 RepID=A0AAW2I758_9NEOP
MDDRNKDSKEQANSSTESLKANCGHSVSSNDVENLLLDNGSDDQPYEKSKTLVDSAVDSEDGTYYIKCDDRKKSIRDLKRKFFDNQYKNIVGNRKEEKKKSNMNHDKEDPEGGVTEKMLAMHNALDDGYGSSNSSPHSAGVISNKSKTPIKAVPISFQWPNKTVSEEVEVELEVGSDGVESHVVVVTTENGIEGDNRETWERRIDFLLSIIGFAVDLANVWRFPYLCYKNGGGAFLIPYTLMMIFGAVPLFYMELILGQYNRQGPISVWRICPIFKGVGFCSVLVAFYVSFYYNVIIAWALYFLTASATPDLPWVHCNNSWNTDDCWESAQVGSTTTNLSNYFSSSNGNGSASEYSGNGEDAAAEFVKNRFSPASEYFHRAVLEMQWSEGIHSMGYPKWQLVICLLVVYMMLYLSLFKGVKSSGLVVWVTATMPYVVLTILLIRGLMLPGALSGISYYLKPELSRLKDTQVWVDAAVQIFYSVGAGFGVHLSYASYNEFHNNCFRDCLVTTAVNCFTSFFSGFVIFTYLGFMSHKHGVPISSVATEGPGLVFQVYPEAVSTLPGSNFWSMLFFFMLIMLGLDSAMGGMECIITGIMDEFHSFFKVSKYSREIFTFCAVTISFSIALVNVTPGGIYTFHLFDTYAAGISLLCCALFEAIAVSWFYGLEKFGDDVEAMIGIRPGLYWRICWKFISPIFIIGVVMFGLFYHQSLQYGEYRYPSFGGKELGGR